MSDKIKITAPALLTGSPALPSSKSESNRALMIHHYSKGRVAIENLSEASDTKILSELLSGQMEVLNAKDAGTTFRFMATMLGLSGKSSILTGSDRMKKRPVGILVDALVTLGAKIEYLENPGFPPLKFSGFEWSGVERIEVDANISSQYISSLMMAAPTLPQGLTISLTNTISSLPYLEMTWDLMKQAGIDGTFKNNLIVIPNQDYVPGILKVESDWSAAGYWFAMAALSPSGSSVFLPGLRKNSIQGDARIGELIHLWGVQKTSTDSGFQIEKEFSFMPSQVSIDFLDIPDLGQTLMVLCPLTGTEARFTGLQSLAIKETNRLLAVKTELRKIGIEMDINEEAGTCYIPGKQEIRIHEPSFETYEDHRMAMALSLVSLARSGEPILIHEPSVVKKSYPGFWEDLKKAGFSVELV
jgi:3-phosphoshikimate 1-carboxyvinyltransferase